MPGIYERAVTGAWRRAMSHVERGVLAAPTPGHALEGTARDMVPHRPVVLIAGYGNSRDGMDAYARGLVRDGYAPADVHTLTLKNFGMDGTDAVSYTHLTLPTKRIV